jgi:uncharacterized protein
VNGARVNVAPDKDGYATLDRVWKNGDIVEVEFPLEIRAVVADAKVAACAGRMAIERGPIVYCAEWPEADGARCWTSSSRHRARSARRPTRSRTARR